MGLTKITPFEVEKWMDKYENDASFNIAETCCASVSMEDLRKLSDDKPQSIIQLDKKLTYGAIPGSDKLRSNVVGLYSVQTVTPLPKENIIISPGAIMANFNVMYALVSRGDHIICHHPTYQQLYSVPESLGAEVSQWKALPENNWNLDIEDLRKLIKSNTKMIIINNPQNPTGAIVPKSILNQIIEIAREHDIIVLSDEVYRPIFHSIYPTDPEFPPSIINVGTYEKVIATGSISKAFALAGLRVGWIASRSTEIITACLNARHYTTISVSQIDDQVSAFALSSSCIDNLLGRNIILAATNLKVLEQFIEAHKNICDWVKPVAGTTAFVRFSRESKPVDDVALCKLAMKKKGILFVPGSLCFGNGSGFHGYIRIGFVCETKVLVEGLAEFGAFVRAEFEKVPLANEVTS